jgi:hypothetical protein
MRGRWLFAIAILSLSFASAYLGGMAAKKAKGTEQSQEVIGGLVIPSESLDMKEVWEAKDIVWRLPIQNRTSGDIEIQKFLSSCGCTAVEPSRLTIPAGETRTVNLLIDLTHRRVEEYALERRPITISIQPITSAARRVNPAAWQIHGIVRSRVTLDAQTVHFGHQAVRGEPAVKRRVLATVHVPCQLLDVRVNPLVATATIKRRQDDPQRYEITIGVNPELPPGNFQTNAKISVVGPNGDSELAFTLPIIGTMQPEVRLLPARVFLEPKEVGKIAEAIVTLQAPTDARVAVDHIEIDDPELRVEPVTIDGIPAGRAYRLRQQVTKEGEQTSTARFVIRKLDQRLLTLPIEVCYRGEQNKKLAESTKERKQP